MFQTEHPLSVMASSHDSSSSFFGVGSELFTNLVKDSRSSVGGITNLVRESRRSLRGPEVDIGIH